MKTIFAVGPSLMTTAVPGPLVTIPDVLLLLLPQLGMATTLVQEPLILNRWDTLHLGEGTGMVGALLVGMLRIHTLATSEHLLQVMEQEQILRMHTEVPLERVHMAPRTMG